MALKRWKELFGVIFPLVLGSLAIFLLLTLLLFFKFHFLFNGLRPELVFLSIIAAHLVAASIPPVIFYSQLKRVTEYTDRVISGKEIDVPGNLSEPFHGIVSDTREMALNLQEKSLTEQRSRDRILATLESMAEGVLMVDSDGKNILVNSTLAGLLGFNRDIAENSYYWEIFRDPVVNEMIGTGLKERRSLDKVHSMLLTNLTFEIQVSPVWSGPEFLGSVAVFHDVTRLKELERLRTEFVANVSHELKTPLTSILGFVETLKDGAVDDKENRGKFLQIIEDHSRNLHALIEDLLFLSRIESGHAGPLRKEKIDLEKMIEKVLAEYKTAVDQKKISLEFSFSEKPFWVEADPGLLERALVNLLDNAIKYNKPSGRIRISAWKMDGRVVLEFIDTGIGISDTDLPRIFERFYRADKSRSRESGGTGLGLSIVKHILEYHGGSVEVRSQVGTGTAFTLRLPA